MDCALWPVSDLLATSVVLRRLFRHVGADYVIRIGLNLVNYLTFNEAPFFLPFPVIHL